MDIPATSDNIPGTLVLRDASGNFSGGSGSGSLTVSTNDRILGRVSAGSGSVEEIVCTAAGRALLDDSSASDQRTTLGCAATSHTHSASDITSDTLNVARLGSGTADNTTFLRGDGAWSVPPAGGSGIPSGAIMAFGMNSAPSGWLSCDGTAVSRSTYADLFTAIGVTHGAGNGSTTFNLPDLRGIFIRGAGSQTISGTTYSGTHATKERDALQGHRHGVTHDAIKTTVASGVGTGSAVNTTAASITITDPTTDGTNGTPRTAAETRPANIALLYCIKT